MESLVLAPELYRLIKEIQMALIIEMERTTKERHSVHKVTRCLVSDFVGSDDKRYLQLDTYGSGDRDFPDKLSQSIQLGEEGAMQLKALIETTFPHL